MIKTKKQLKTAIKDAGQAWKDLAITSKEMAAEIKRAVKQYELWIYRNKENKK